MLNGSGMSILPAKLASAKCIAVLFIVSFIYLFICFFLVHRDGCADLNGFFYAEQSKGVFSVIQNMLNAPGWSRRDHADWYTVLTDPDNDD